MPKLLILIIFLTFPVACLASDWAASLREATTEPPTDPVCTPLSKRGKSSPPLDAPELKQAPAPELPLFEARVTETEMAKNGILFQWTALPGTSQYRFRIFQKDKIVKDETTATARLLVPRLPAGLYRWNVAGRYRVDRPGEGKWNCEGRLSPSWELTVLSPSDADGTEDFERRYFAGNSHVSVLPRLGTYLYRSSSATSPGGSGSPALAAGFVASGEYRLSPKASIAGSVENTFYGIEGRTANGTAIETKLRTKIALKQKPGWMLLPAAGVRASRYFQFTRPCAGCPAPYTELVALGPALSAELLKPLGPKARLVFSWELSYPLLLLSGPSSSGLSGFNLNGSFAVYATWELAPKWELRYGGYYEHRGLRFERAGSGESTQLDALGAFVGLALRFGR